jgi:hypothetical protein
MMIEGEGSNAQIMTEGSITLNRWQNQDKI